MSGRPHRRDRATQPAGRAGLVAALLLAAATPAGLRAQAQAQAQAQAPAGATANQFGTGNLDLVVIPRARAGTAGRSGARTAKPIAPATRALMWRRPARLGTQLSPTGALAPR